METQCYVISFMCDKSENVLSIPRASPANDCCFLLCFFFIMFPNDVSAVLMRKCSKVIIIILKQCVISMQLA